MALRRLHCATLKEGSVSLAAEESRHAVKVLRLAVGDEVELFDGQGGLAVGRVVVANARRLELEVPRVDRRPADHVVRLTLAVAMPRAHRQSYLVEKCTELGVHAIWPMATERSVATPSGGAVEKLRRRVLEACKQSRRRWLPEIGEVRGFPDVLEAFGSFDQVCLLDTVGAVQPLGDLTAAWCAGLSVVALIGPEGGFTDEERHAASMAGALSVGLGAAVLRTETASIAVCAAASLCSA